MSDLCNSHNSDPVDNVNDVNDALGTHVLGNHAFGTSLFGHHNRIPPDDAGDLSGHDNTSLGSVEAGLGPTIHGGRSTNNFTAVSPNPAGGVAQQLMFLTAAVTREHNQQLQSYKSQNAIAWERSVDKLKVTPYVKSQLSE